MRLLRSWGLGAAYRLGSASLGAAYRLGSASLGAAYRLGSASLGAAVALCVTATVAVGQVPAPAPAPSPVITFPECTKKPTQADTEGAKGAHNAAKQFYDRGEFEKALRYWNDAYAFDCSANDLLINIANAYDKLGDRASAVATLETYLKRSGPNPAIEARLKKLKERAPPPPPPPTAAPTAAPTASPTAVPTAPPPSGPRPYGITPWLVVGGGGALAIVGAILLPIGMGAIADVERVCGPDHKCPPGTSQELAEKGNVGRVQVGAGGALLGVGLAAAGGGLVWQLLFNKPKPAAPLPAPPRTKKKGMWVSPAAGPGQVGVALGGSF